MKKHCGFCTGVVHFLPSCFSMRVFVIVLVLILRLNGSIMAADVTIWSSNSKRMEVLDDMQAVADKFWDEYQVMSSCNDTCVAAAGYAQFQLDNGSWSDVNYHDQSRVIWTAMTHWDRCLTMTRAFNCPACKNVSSVSSSTLGFNSSLLLGHIKNGTAFWIEEGFQNPNWWYNDIGMPLTAIKVYMLLNFHSPRGSALSADEINKADVLWEGAETWANLTGQNRIWTRTIVLQKGLLHANISSVSASFDGLFSTVLVEHVQETEGIMADGSFHQHGPLLQSGSYGSDFFCNVANLIYLASNTSFETSDEHGRAFATFVLDGEQWMMRVISAPTVQWDFSVTSRAITRPSTLDLNFATTAKQIQSLGFNRSSEFKTFASRLVDNNTTKVGVFTGDKHFHLSDYHVHHAKDWVASVKMFSTRVYNAECVNEEGQLSWHLSDGVTSINVHGDEVAGIFPVWNWNKLPGTTGWQGAPQETPCATVKQMGKSSFVGGVSDGNIGVATFDFVANDFYGKSVRSGMSSSIPGPVTARKSWFFSPTMIVALGANITAEPSAIAAARAETLEQEVTTSVTQVLLHGAVELSNGTQLSSGVHNISSQSWVRHHDIVYKSLMPGQDIRAAIQTQTGSWHRINLAESNVTVAKTVLTLEYLHGKSPRGAKYAYAIVPSLAAKPNVTDPVIVANTASVQAIRQGPSLQAVVFEPSLVNEIDGGPGFLISNVTSQCALQVTATSDNNRVVFSIADPSQTNDPPLAMSFTIDRVVSGTSSTGGGTLTCLPNSDHSTSTIKIVMPGGIHAGSSISNDCIIVQ